MTSRITTCLMMLAFFSGCLAGVNTRPTAGSRNDSAYVIVSSVPYNQSLCGFTGYRYQEGGLNTALRLNLRDRETGERLEGKARITTPNGGGTLTVTQSYSCEMQINPRQAVVSVYSGGHTPSLFTLPEGGDTMMTLEVPLQKSCTGGPSCFDDTEESLLARASGNETAAGELRTQTKIRFLDILNAEFGLNSSDYQLDCAECDMGRGGFIKARGLYNNQTTFELYYHTGWCSPGGGDCVWSLCLAADSDELLSSVQDLVCSRLMYFNTTEQQSEPEAYRTVVTADATNETIRDCLNGAYNQNENKKTFSIVQNSNRGGAWITRGNPNCLEN